MTPHTELVNDLLKLAVDSGASDVVVKSGKPGYVRLSGRYVGFTMTSNVIGGYWRLGKPVMFVNQTGTRS